MKQMDSFLKKLPDAICDRKGEQKRAFSCTLSVLGPKIFWTKTVKTRKNYKK